MIGEYAFWLEANCRGLICGLVPTPSTQVQDLIRVSEVRVLVFSGVGFRVYGFALEGANRFVLFVCLLGRQLQDSSRPASLKIWKASF